MQDAGAEGTDAQGTVKERLKGLESECGVAADTANYAPTGVEWKWKSLGLVQLL